MSVDGLERENRDTVTGSSMFCMSEQEKYEQVGRLAEEYSHLRGQLNHVSEKLSRAHAAYQFAAASFQNLRLIDGKIAGPSNPQQRGTPDLSDLCNFQQLTELFEERDKLNRELADKSTRLKALAPHLL
jgi:hypothetical protein